MATQEELKVIVDIPQEEKEQFDKLCKECRAKYIEKTDVLVDRIFDENPQYTQMLKDGKASEVILEAREKVWQVFLIQEADFNTHLMGELSSKLETPRDIIEKLTQEHIIGKTGDELIAAVRNVCGEYAGRVYPYIYALSLSNTNSRRSRSGSTFQNLIYKVYELLGYSYVSQKAVGKKVFEEAGLGKLVDSLLPGIEEFSQRRDKTVIGTMKTSLRERWQEVIEEIQRTNIPSIYLLTLDDAITLPKVKQMANHNVILVVPNGQAMKEGIDEMKNVISFEEYLYEEIPAHMSYWKK